MELVMKNLREELCDKAHRKIIPLDYIFIYEALVKTIYELSMLEISIGVDDVVLVKWDSIVAYSKRKFLMDMTELTEEDINDFIKYASEHCCLNLVKATVSNAPTLTSDICFHVLIAEIYAVV